MKPNGEVPGALENNQQANDEDKKDSSILQHDAVLPTEQT